MTTFDEEELDPEPSLPRPGFAHPGEGPPVGPDLDTSFRLRPRHQFHVEWGTTWFKNLGQPSYLALPVPFSQHVNPYVQYLIKVKHAIDPYLFLWK